jgi:hypothetical protein
MTSIASDAYLSLKALSGYAGLSVRTLRGYLTSATHPLPHFRVGGKLLVKRSEFDQWISGFRAESAGASVDAVVDEILRRV